MCAVWLLGCGKQKKNRAQRPQRVDVNRDIGFGSADLARDLESAMLENYLQMSLGNTEAFADSIAREQDVVLIGVGPKDVVTRANPSERVRDWRLFADRPHCVLGLAEGEPCIRVLPKTLDLHLYRDDSVGWIADEISYRVPHKGREAAIPLRMTAVWVRDIDRWALVTQHISYGLPLDAIWELARRGELTRPKPIGTYFDDRGRARLLKRLLTKRLTADDKGREHTRKAVVRRRRRVAESLSTRASAQTGEEGASGADAESAAGESEVPAMIDESALIVFYPGTKNEFHGPAVYEAPSLVELFGPEARLAMGEHRVSVAENKRVAWMTALVTVTAQDPEFAKERAILLRVTAVFAFDSYGWNIMQIHVSVPVTEAQIAGRLFASPDTP